ncbi:MAG: hypothetical protein H6757_03125 [Candidatus Omnitrophica bacterium]|nr:hypothetical protein [Candidatus Omnitrophota bacterium]
MKRGNSIHLRTRLFRKVMFRIWKTFMLRKAKRYLGDVKYESIENFLLPTPAIIICNFEELNDFLILSYLCKDKNLCFLTTTELPDEKWIKELKAMNHVLPFDYQKNNFSFLRSILRSLRDFNRSVVISNEAAKKYADGINVDLSLIVRIAMKASVPIMPIVMKKSLTRQSNKIAKRDIFVGKKISVSPRALEFKDIFFKRRGVRKFSELPREDMAEIGRRILAKIQIMKENHGSNL